MTEENFIKVEQADANYRVGNDEQSCAGCVNYEAPDSCGVVKGIIAASALCDLFQPHRKDVAQLTEELF